MQQALEKTAKGEEKPKLQHHLHNFIYLAFRIILFKHLLDNTFSIISYIATSLIHTFLSPISFSFYYLIFNALSLEKTINYIFPNKYLAVTVSNLTDDVRGACKYLLLQIKTRTSVISVTAVGCRSNGT